MQINCYIVGGGPFQGRHLSALRASLLTGEYHDAPCLPPRGRWIFAARQKDGRSLRGIGFTASLLRWGRLVPFGAPFPCSSALGPKKTPFRGEGCFLVFYFISLLLPLGEFLI